MTPAATKVPKTKPPTQIDTQAYNAFVATVQPVRIELTELSAKTAHSDAADVSLQVESRFVVTCPKKDDAGFTAEARLELRFLADTGAEVGHVQCTYRLEYQATMSLSEGMLDQFSSANAPAIIWPFMRELVMNLTLKFGWSGFVLPSFLIPPVTANASAGVPAAPVEKARKARQGATKT
jgi:preprotein translocase subunit SecB